MLTLPEKRERLRKLPAEVPDFHNWLEVLFRVMPYVKHVEYTHGRDEFGADFVLEVENPTIGRNEFVGIIAKKGTIKQDTTEVERQIKECGIPRIIKNGRDEQSLPIIWVVSNEGVTTNAQRKIRNEYRELAIQFFGSDDVIKWTDACAPHLWDNIPSKIGQYLHDVSLRLEELNRSAAILTDQMVSGSKLDLDLVPVDPDAYKRRKSAPLVSLVEEAKIRRIIFVEGEMGAGKSQLLRDLGMELTRATVFAERGQLPIFVTYRELQDTHDGSISRLVGTALGELASEVEKGRATVTLLIDGLDEVGSGESVGDLLVELADNVRRMENVSAVITCRSGVVPGAIVRATADIRHLEVRPLSVRKIANFIKAVCARANVSERTTRELGRSDLFRQLPQNPIAALLLSRLMLQSPLRSELPQTLPELYSKALELMLGRWDIEKGLWSQQQYEVAVRICGQVAKLMLENRIPAIAVSEIETRVREYLRERNLTIDGRELLERLFSRSGVLVRDESSLTASFKHRSFAEFFCADEWLRSSSFAVDLRALDPYWATVYFFAIGQLSDCEQTLKAILGLQPMSESQRFHKVMASPAYLLAGHMTPYRIVEEALPGLLTEAAQLYVEISSGKVQSSLSTLPPLPLLYIVQMLVRYRYGYQFFRKALDGTAVAIEDSIADDMVKAYALFFVGVIGIDLEYPDALKFLAAKYKAGQLPIGLSVAVTHESEKAQPRGMPHVLRAFNKRVRSMLKGNRALRATLENLFSRPSGASTVGSEKSPRRRYLPGPT